MNPPHWVSVETPSRHQQCHGQPNFKHDVKKQVTVCLGVSIRLPARTESFGVDQFCWGWKTLRVDHNAVGQCSWMRNCRAAPWEVPPWPCQTKTSGACKLLSNTGRCTNPLRSSVLTFHFISRRKQTVEHAGRMSTQADGNDANRQSHTKSNGLQSNTKMTEPLMN